MDRTRALPLVPSEGFIRPRLDCWHEHFPHLVTIFPVWCADAHASNQGHTCSHSDAFIPPLQARMCGCQKRTAPHAPLFRTCSTLHNASAERGLRIQISCDGAKPRDARAMTCSACGGCTMTMLRLATLASAGASRRISPMPGCWTSRSISVPTGQPPPGSWPDKATWPVSMHRTSARANCDARHNDGCNVSGAGALVAVIASDRQRAARILAVTPAVDNFAIPTHCGQLAGQLVSLLSSQMYCAVLEH